MTAVMCAVLAAVCSANTVYVEPAYATSYSAEESEEVEEPEMPEEEAGHVSEYSSNEELIASQNITAPTAGKNDYRFTTVYYRYAIVSNKDGVSVLEEKSDDARVIGSLDYYGCCFILEDEEDGWYYVESGYVRGFIHAEDVVTDETAERIVNVRGIDTLPHAEQLVYYLDNAAFDHTHTTTQQVLVEKEYAVADGSVNIYEQRDTSARVIGVLPEDGLCFILADGDQDWVFVESGDARGFVKKEELRTGEEAVSVIAAASGEDNMAFAEVQVAPEDNAACYYTLTSVKVAASEDKLRNDIVNFALQYVGNPYVWGGTSLTEGADCSGFVQSVYACFGYTLPRVAEDQAYYGVQVPLEYAEPGDLIFYARNGYIYHVSMYIGDGQVVHAAGRKVGIIVSGIAGNAVWASKIVSD